MEQFIVQSLPVFLPLFMSPPCQRSWGAFQFHPLNFFLSFVSNTSPFNTVVLLPLLPLMSILHSFSHFSLPPHFLQTPNRTATSSCTTCVLSAMPSGSPRRFVLTGWSSAPSTKTTQRWRSATAESCCGSSNPTLARPLPIPGTVQWK